MFKFPITRDKNAQDLTICRSFQVTTSLGLDAENFDERDIPTQFHILRNRVAVKVIST